MVPGPLHVLPHPVQMLQGLLASTTPLTSPCCTDKGLDLLRSFALFTLVPFSSCPLYCQGSIHWLHTGCR